MRKVRRKDMRLVRLTTPGGLENLKLFEENQPKPRPGELLARIRASSLNFQEDAEKSLLGPSSAFHGSAGFQKFPLACLLGLL